MLSSSGDSDVRSDRIQAREDQYRRDVQARRRATVAKRIFDKTELDSIGAHFDLSVDEPRPHSLELTDNEATADGSPISRTCTPTKCGGDLYLSTHEYKQLQRQRPVNKRRRISLCTTVEPGTQSEPEGNGEIETHDIQFSSHTPSHGSRALTDKEECSVKNAKPSSPVPWSQPYRTVGKND